MDNFSASLLFHSSSGSYADGKTGGGIFVNGTVKASEVRLSATDLTVGVTGSIMTSLNGNNAMSNGGNGKFIVQTSKSNSGAIINNADGNGYNLSFIRTVDGSSEWSLLEFLLLIKIYKPL